MTLAINVTAPFLCPKRLKDLVQAVREADPQDEHRWIEWKSTLDLTKPAGLGHIVKHVIGLANRDPDAAKHRAGGYGYLLIGIEPGNLCGITRVDPEVLVGQVRAYVGDSIRWTPEYLTIDGSSILIIIVDPPQPGDGIHCLRKATGGSFQPGAIFVRHTGRTDPATPADIDMLQARLLDRTPRLQFEVRPTNGAIETIPACDSTISDWGERLRPTLLSARYHPTEQEQAGTTLAWSSPDLRSLDEYIKEVEQYLKKVKDTYFKRILWRLSKYAPAQLAIEVSNSTEIGYSAIRLRLHISGNVKGYESTRKVMPNGVPNFPSPPKPLGTPSQPAWLAAFPQRKPKPSIQNDPRPGFTVRNDGLVQFDDFDLRPHDTVQLPSIPLIVRERPNAVLAASWNATGDGTRGQLSGEFALTVTESTLDPSALLKGVS